MHCPFWSTKEYWFTFPGTACRFGAVFGGSTDHCKSLGTSDTYDQGHRKLETRKQKSVRRKRELRFWAWFQQNETEKKEKRKRELRMASNMNINIRDPAMESDDFYGPVSKLTFMLSKDSSSLLCRSCIWKHPHSIGKNSWSRREVSHEPATYSLRERCETPTMQKIVVERKGLETDQKFENTDFMWSCSLWWQKLSQKERGNDSICGYSRSSLVK